MTLNQSQFDLRSNLKNKPNAQGTLFKADKSQRTPESRQPRGYSPERMQAVRKTLTPGGINRSNMEAYEISRTGKTPTVVSGQDQAMRTVARSTVPLSDIQGKSGMGNVSMHATKSIDTGAYNGIQSGAAGEYRKAVGPYDPTIHVAPKYTNTFVPIHEIGHHVDRAEPYKTPHQKGRAEGFADAYADKHAKKPGYKRQPATTVPRDSGSYGIWTKGMSQGMASAFNERYQQQRPTLQEAQFGPGKDLPKNHVPGQNRLLDKSVGGTSWNPDVKAPATWHYPLD